MHFLGLLFLALAFTNSGYLPRPTPLADEVHITLTADSDEYVAYEPVRLRVELRNVSGREVMGYFGVTPAVEHCEIQYRRAGEAFLAFPIQRSPRHGFIVPHALEPGGVVSGEFILAFDRERERFVLDGEGIFEFRAAYRDTPDDPNTLLESATISVRSHPVPANEAEHVVAYRNPGLGRLVQFQPFVGSDLPHEAIESAASFLGEHEDSLYARHVRRGLVSALGDLVGFGLATEREQALYETLHQNEGVLAGAAGTARDMPRPGGAPSERLELAISTEREGYYLNEPVRLRIALRNVGEQVVTRQLLLNPDLDRLKIYYQRDSGERLQATRALQKLRRKYGVVALSEPLAPGETRSRDVIVAFDAATGRPVLDETGSVEIQAVYPGCDPNSTLKSNTLRLRVSAPPAEDEEAARAFGRERIGLLAQDDYVDGPVEESSIEFLEKHGKSRYATYLRPGLKKLLQRRVSEGNTTERETALLEMLAEDAEDGGTWSDRGLNYKAGDVVRYEGTSWRCRQSHRPEAGRTPVLAPTLWEKVTE